MADEGLFEMAKAVQDANVESFKAGWKAGAGDALRLALGRPASGGSPYRGQLPDDFVAWASRALAKLEQV